MQLILLQKVKNLGNLGDKVNVKPGYGRNYLVPQGKAAVANEANLAEFEQRRADYEAKANTQLAGAEARKAQFEAAEAVTIKANASTEGYSRQRVEQATSGAYQARFQNAERAMNVGVELEARKQLGFLGD